MAAGVTSSVTRRSCRRSRTSASCSSTIGSMSAIDRASNVTMSSMRFKNSGRNVARSASSMARCFVSSAFSSPFSENSRMNCDPTLLVMMMIVFLKLTTRPWPSVRRPSSRTCSSTLNTSGCAFSISSSKTTLYGRRRTASVSWPPSS